MRNDDYPLYIVNIRKKTYEKISCGSDELRAVMKYAISAVSWVFNEEIGDNLCIKYVEPEFEEKE